MISKFTTTTPEDLVPVARELIRLITTAEKSRIDYHALVLLSGPMGVGKTKFVETIVRELSSKMPEVTSPTFALHQVYHLSDGKKVDHFDLYRLQSDDEIESAGFWDALALDTGLILVEWPEKLPGMAIPGENNFQAPGWTIFKVRMSLLDTGAREIIIQGEQTRGLH